MSGKKKPPKWDILFHTLLNTYEYCPNISDQCFLSIGFINVKRKISHLRCFYNIFTVIFVCFKGDLKHCIKMFALYRMELSNNHLY